MVSGSAVWQRFTKVDGVGGICKQCLKEVLSKSGTSNLHKHLKDNHPELVVGKMPPNRNNHTKNLKMVSKMSSSRSSPYDIQKSRTTQELQGHKESTHETPKKSQPTLIHALEKTRSFKSKSDKLLRFFFQSMCL